MNCSAGHLGKSGEAGVGGCSKGWFRGFIEVGSCAVVVSKLFIYLPLPYHSLHQ